MLSMLVVLLSFPAQAGWVVDYAEDWDASNVVSYSGTDGWVSGYTLDTWTTDGVSGLGTAGIVR
jgi:hypothetical protein